MKKRKISKIIQMIGKQEGISAKEVEKEIQIAIDSGFDNPDAKIRAAWEKVPFKGERPTTQEVVEYLCKEIMK